MTLFGKSPRIRPTRSNLRSRQGRRGQGLVEFALILPVVALLLLITLDFGRMFMSYITLTNETRIAANYGATNPGAFTGTPNTAVYDALLARESVDLCPLEPDAGGHNPPLPTFPSGTGLSGVSVATLSCRFSFLTPLIGNVFGGALTVSAKSEYPIRTGAIANIGGTTVLPPPGSPISAFVFTNVTGGTIDGSGNVSGPGPITVNVINQSQFGQSYDWNWGDGSVDDVTFTPPAHQFTSGTHTVKLTVANTVNPSGVFSTRTITVTPVSSQPPSAGFFGFAVAPFPQFISGGGSSGTPIQGNITSSQPLVVDFTNQSTNGATAYSWDFGDGSAASVGVNPSHQYSQLGVFSVTLTVTAPTGGTPFTRTNYITTGCLVPNFANTHTDAAQATWSSYQFTGTITYTNTNKNTSSTTPPNGNPKINSQDLPGGGFVVPTQVGASWVCNNNIELKY
jgi:PKD repeat protein